jgi:hypothetical protein
MYKNLLNKIHEQKISFGELAWQPKGEDSLLLEFSQQVIKKLKTEIPKAFLDFLRITNGLNWNGLFIYSAGESEDFEYDFIEMNLNYRDVDYFQDLLVFGEGNSEIYTYEISTKEYQIRDRVPADNIIEKCRSFDAMIEKALETHL